MTNGVSLRSQDNCQLLWFDDFDDQHVKISAIYIIAAKTTTIYSNNCDNSRRNSTEVNSLTSSRQNNLKKLFTYGSGFLSV